VRGEPIAPASRSLGPSGVEEQGGVCCTLQEKGLEAAPPGLADDASFCEETPRHGREEPEETPCGAVAQKASSGRRLSNSSVESLGFGFGMGMSGSTAQRSFLGRVVRSLPFESFMSACILANCVTVGVWAHQLVTSDFSPEVERFTEALEHSFVAIFLVELLLKVKVYGCGMFKPGSPNNRSNFVDMMLVLVTGLLFTWVVPLCALIFGFDSSAGAFKTLTVLRTVRLARLVRVFQRSPLFREAWMLIRGLGDSSRTLLWTCLVIFLVTYVFAIVGLATLVTELQAIRQQDIDAADAAIIDELLVLMGGLDRLMAALVQVLLGDSFHAFTTQILKYIWWSWVYFYTYISIAVVVLMNLVTAIIVENAMETSRADHDHVASEKEIKRKKDIGRLRKLFRSLDTDGGGTLSWDEFKSSFDDPDIARQWMVLDFEQADCEELFRLLDDGDGEITIEEFMEALSRMSGAAQAKDVFKMQKTLEKVQVAIDSASACQHIKH